MSAMILLGPISKHLTNQTLISQLTTIAPLEQSGEDDRLKVQQSFTGYNQTYGWNINYMVSALN